MSAQIIDLADRVAYRVALRQIEEAIAEIQAIKGRTEEKRAAINALLSDMRAYDHLPADCKPQEVPFA